MTKKSRLLAFMIVLFAVATINMRTVLDANHSYDLTMASIEAISGEGDKNENGTGGIPGETEIKNDPKICDTDGSGKCYAPRAIVVENSDKCRLRCVATGKPKDYCNKYWIGILDLCTNMF